MTENILTRFENTTSLQALTEQELENTAGGIAPFLIGAGIVAGLGGGFFGGYALARIFG